MKFKQIPKIYCEITSQKQGLAVFEHLSQFFEPSEQSRRRLESGRSGAGNVIATFPLSQNPLQVYSDKNWFKKSYKKHEELSTDEVFSYPGPLTNTFEVNGVEFETEGERVRIMFEGAGTDRDISEVTSFLDKLLEKRNLHWEISAESFKIGCKTFSRSDLTEIREKLNNIS